MGGGRLAPASQCDSEAAWQRTQRVADGRTASRSAPICPPQSSQIPSTPSARRSAACAAASRLRSTTSLMAPAVACSLSICVESESRKPLLTIPA